MWCPSGMWFKLLSSQIGLFILLHSSTCTVSITQQQQPLPSLRQNNEEPQSKNAKANVESSSPISGYQRDEHAWDEYLLWKSTNSPPPLHSYILSDDRSSRKFTLTTTSHETIESSPDSSKNPTTTTNSHRLLKKHQKKHYSFVKNLRRHREIIKQHSTILSNNSTHQSGGGGVENVVAVVDNNHHNDKHDNTPAGIVPEQYFTPTSLQSYYDFLKQQQQHGHQESDKQSMAPATTGIVNVTFLRGHANRHKQIFHPTLSYHCISLPQTTTNRWLRTDGAPTGLGNQLFGVYSFLAAAYYFNSSLIVGDIYSRSSFELPWPLSISQWRALPFSSFFDWPYFNNFWKIRGVETVETQQYDHCPESPEKLRPLNLIRYPEYWPYDYSRRLKMLEYNNVSIPLPENIMIHLIADQKFITFGLLFEFPHLMLDVFQSLEPAPVIAKFIRLIQKQLLRLSSSKSSHPEMPYFAAHLRLENDVHGVHDIPQRREIHRNAIDYLINNNTCLSSWPRDPKYHRKLLNPPPLYIASGLWGKRADLQKTLDIFVKNGTMNDTSVSKLSLQDFTLYLLSQAGFRKIFTKHTIIYPMENAQSKFILLQEKRKKDIEFKKSAAKKDGVPMQPLDKNKEAHYQREALKFKDGLVDYHQYYTLLPEQWAMIDLYVSRYAPCFCSAHVRSSFSYWVMRMKALSERKHLHIAEVNSTNYGHHAAFAGWGV